jgi:hypothetical protein
MDTSHLELRGVLGYRDLTGFDTGYGMYVCDNDGIHQQIGPRITLEGHGAQYQLDGRVRVRLLDPTNEVNDESAR